MSRPMLLALALVLVASAACHDATSASGDASPDSTADDAAPSAAVVCSAPLIAPCDTTTLASASACPGSMSEEGTDCELSPLDDCYYCSGAPSAWTTADRRPLANCVDGRWRLSAVHCGAGP